MAILDRFAYLGSIALRAFAVRVPSRFLVWVRSMQSSGHNEEGPPTFRISAKHCVVGSWATQCDASCLSVRVLQF